MPIIQPIVKQPQQLTVPSNLNQLATSLQAIQPKSPTAQLITYALIATALVGIFVYHYIRKQEANN
ncbi:hypothetical protein [endosymbiont GvMRE of Glomus versiforme]|uniref:hypothetical protein n=1 Tax=endosymbiont GvMRE of Glomus versiforme TaxID=2039283 RepID=UPI000EE3E67A|nr:hypothetical protein [endosymbiont GvMRE of Glomus versiforme]RHZ36602.1 hypothetical protein GvMRE_I2g555 [endosymbiont GvMRE of Glomus versiforme]RHZ37380.1 hypothetical protein GvMRE_I1g727 [endosymbiont GvMRE of Glomus versiforme]